MPDSTILADYALARLNRVIENMQAHPERMLKNMDLSHGLYFSQRVLTSLIDKGMERQKAYETVQRLAMRSWQDGLPFPDLVRQDEEISSLLDKEDLNSLFDVNFYLRYENEILDRVFGENGAA